MSAGLENGGSVGKSEGHGDIMDEDCGGEEGHVFNDDQGDKTATMSQGEMKSSKAMLVEC